MATNVEGGLQNKRIEFVRESTIGSTPSNPSWNKFSERVVDVTASFGGNTEGRRGINTSTPHDIDSFSPAGQNPEEHTMSLTYDLYDWLTSSGDAAYDAFTRDNDGNLNNTHTVVVREDMVTGGSASGGRRSYIVGKGGYTASASIVGDPGTSDPVQIDSLDYQFEKMRYYEIDQPSSGTTVTAVSSATGDTSQTVTIENEGAGTTATLSLSGTTTQTTTATFSDIDSVSLDSETAGDVTITDGSNDLIVISGQNTYDGVEGDLGVPPLGTGTHASSLSGVEEFIGDSVERPGGTTLEDIINSTSFNVDNNVDTTSQHDTMRMQIDVGNRDITVDATVLGENAAFTTITEHLKTTATNIKWTLDGGDITADSAVLTDPSDVSYTDGQTRLSLDNTFTGQGVTIN